MIYIPFFIVILIDKRGVREAERGGKRERTVRTHNDIHNDIQRTIQRTIPSGTEKGTSESTKQKKV